ncbi:MAG TPA: hypothetical protein VJ549_09495, partial [Geothrix sp.]|nr:hypothetical protein [Geothrix sp.]
AAVAGTAWPDTAVARSGNSAVVSMEVASEVALSAAEASVADGMADAKPIDSRSSDQLLKPIPGNWRAFSVHGCPLRQNLIRFLRVATSSRLLCDPLAAFSG